MRFQAERLAAVRGFNPLKLSKSKNMRNDMNEGMPFLASRQGKQVLYQTRQTSRLNQASKERKDKTENQYLTRAAMRE
jgi:hypothetical protein